MLFSAAYREGSSLLRLWGLPNTTVLTSTYAAAARNALDSEHQDRVLALLSNTTVVVYDTDGRAGTLYIQSDVSLPDKDWPILLAALDTGSTHLLTGDKQHFGHLFGVTIQGTRIMLPGRYLRARDEGGSSQYAAD
ncbi:MAG: hypothetical protein ACIAS6_14805 [Phycisphaerales bacterium JB060]